MKTSMYVAASMDGFIARPDGDMKRWSGDVAELHYIQVQSGEQA